jgi:hypothetical protein
MRSSAAVLRRPVASPSLAAGMMGKSDKKRAVTPVKTGIDQEGKEVDQAFDVWLRRGLHQLYDTVAQEPIPDELLRLIEDDRDASKK